MQEKDKARFSSLIGNVYAFYRQDISEFAIGVWWQAGKPFEYDEVADALNRHCVNPDNGQFMPKPADVVKMLQGSTKDGALIAWSKVDKAVRQVGTYNSVAFDDPIIHAVIQDMGGWVAFGAKDEKEWPFVRNEFENRYRGYRMRNDTGDYPHLLVGIADAQNSQRGFACQEPVLIGDASRAMRVIESGSTKPAIGFTRVAPGALLPAAKEHDMGYQRAEVRTLQ
ncbi:DUF6475 domain-containing protein [Alcaligenaceae bacterium B3P038]|nr:DUF6475 domain-containing protein [Alcaligenaceae bacterium B3P038]